MTQTTEQERAECKAAFDAVRAKEFKRLSEKFDFKGIEDFHARGSADWVTWQEAWQAARRAPVVQSGWQELAAKVMDALANAQDATNRKYPEHVKCYPSWETSVLHLRWHAEMFRTGKPWGSGAGNAAVLEALAAAPQPPDGAQVFSHMKPREGGQAIAVDTLGREMPGVRLLTIEMDALKDAAAHQPTESSMVPSSMMEPAAEQVQLPALTESEATALAAVYLPVSRQADGVALIRAMEKKFSAMPVAESKQWKDHNTAELVNELTATARTYREAQQLRERIAGVIRPLAERLKVVSKP